jgi:hypothetical protein
MGHAARRRLTRGLWRLAQLRVGLTVHGDRYPEAIQRMIDR